jgi:hypothetical protein
MCTTRARRTWCGANAREQPQQQRQLVNAGENARAMAVVPCLQEQWCARQIRKAAYLLGCLQCMLMHPPTSTCLVQRCI